MSFILHFDFVIQTKSHAYTINYLIVTRKTAVMKISSKVNIHSTKSIDFKKGDIFIEQCHVGKVNWKKIQYKQHTTNLGRNINL